MISESTEKTKKKGEQPWISLKVKWAIAVAGSLFVTFLLFAILLYESAGNVLMQQERRNVEETMTTVTTRLQREKQPLTTSSVADLTRFDQSSHTVYQDSLLNRLTNKDISVAIFNPSQKRVLQFRDFTVPFHATLDRHVAGSRAHGQDVLVGMTPVKSDKTGQIVGYVQVVNQLGDYHNVLTQMRSWLYSLSLLAIIFSATVGYVLATRFLRPIKMMTDTIKAINEEPLSDKRIPQQHSQDELSDLIDEFNGMLDRIQHYVDTQQQFVQDVSHELRTPVAVIEGHLQLLNRWGKDDPKVLDESLAASLQETERMKSLIQEMLELTRADAVETQYLHEVTNAGDLVHQVFANFQMLHPDFKFILDDDLHGPTWARIYRNHLEQILIILMDNAVKYSTTRKEIHLAVASDAHHVDIVVQDFGEGISKDDLAQVFNRFYRVDKARSREKGGNGLGLSIAKRLVDGYHGQLTVESVVGSGSVFKISLLRAAPPKEDPPTAADVPDGILK
ncbi:HAMP domain protein [Lactobacillus selangorensis]|uniref:Signal transduction histidine-protein kinase ArlS n=1 Tax=Lactobacillus selangorensis TaxID=81857 RepID=A0A0R2FZ57_9LACO|nr:HAMP domain-containing histidine kinase [Lactobacillus selangorensis]KRN29724.1 HAMP domain protein [Lactobacillus selangorensis]KRN33747.1 HAMP domain protein [Lactobacillus selangorensis]